MSWMPDQDPVLGDKRSCDALDLVIVPRAREAAHRPAEVAETTAAEERKQDQPSLA